MASNHHVNLLNTLASAGDVNGDFKNLGTSYAKFIGVIKCANVDAATTVTGKIQHSHDGLVWTSICDFAAITATLFEHKQITVNVLPLVRAIFTLAGTTKLADVKIDLYFDK